MSSIVRVARISRSGQIFLPAEVRRRWAVQEVTLTDLGESVLVRPVGPPPQPGLAAVSPPTG